MYGKKVSMDLWTEIYNFLTFEKGIPDEGVQLKRVDFKNGYLIVPDNRCL